MTRMTASQQKLAEKLIILDNRAVGILTRVYNIKKVCFELLLEIFATSAPLKLVS